VELEAELAAVKRATELFAEGRVVRPEALFAIVETLAREGHGTKRVCRLLRVAPSCGCRKPGRSPDLRLCRAAGAVRWLSRTARRTRIALSQTLSAHRPRVRSTGTVSEPFRADRGTSDQELLVPFQRARG
jgi:hypothetical protein